MIVVALTPTYGWLKTNSFWLGDLATWLTGLFTFAAFYLAYRIFKQNQDRDQKEQASQVAVWADLTSRTSKEAKAISPFLKNESDIRTTYNINVANHSAAPIMGAHLSVSTRAWFNIKKELSVVKEEEEQIRLWLQEADWRRDIHSWADVGFEPWVLGPGSMTTVSIRLAIDIEYCSADIRFFDSRGRSWVKDLKTGELKARERSVGLINARALPEWAEQPERPESSRSDDSGAPEKYWG